MADAAVQFLIENLQELVTYRSKLITEATKEVEQLQNDFRLFKQFLKDTAKKRRTEDSLVELVRQIRDVVYKAEDVIDSFVIQAAEPKWKNCFKNSCKDISNLHGVAVEVARVRSEVDKIYGGKSRLQFAAEMRDGDNGDERVEAPLVRKENIVGFEDEEEKLKSYICQQTQNLDVVSIIGMGGIGKTTLAQMIYHDLEVESNFSTRMWVCVSQQFNQRDVFKSILKQLGSTTDDETYHKTDRQLPQEIMTRLKGKKFLIVLDDVWTISDWDKLRIAFPWDNNMGKILLTSRNEEVARYANRSRSPHSLRFLSHDESWLLLKYSAFGRPVCPSALEAIGQSIAKECNGLPLAIIAIGGILVRKLSTDAWTKVLNSVGACPTKEPERRMENIIDLSYNSLPYDLRPCFLYFSIFPEDFEIPASTLIQLWIAEGFIIQVKENISLEETAEKYLEDLVNRNLVRIDKTRSDGKIKTCCIHDMLRDFCITKAGDERENFLHEITRSSEERLKPSVANMQYFRRISMHSNAIDLLTAKPFGPHIRSFVCCSKEDMILPKESISTILADFKLLRVWEAKSLKFKKIPKDLYQLIHLRFIRLSLDDLKVLPQSISNLRNIRTLLVNTTSRTLKVEADIWKMKHLTHLMTNTSTTLPKPGKTSLEGANLRTLGAISPESCTNEVFDQAHNLKELCVQGKLTMLLDGKIDSLGRLENLEKLKLRNDVFPIPPSEAPMRALPPPYKFPPELRSLTLSGTYLNWVHMSVLGKLENLAVLKLKNSAFVGKKYVTTDDGFNNLEFLLIERTDLVDWEASDYHFPRLKCLELRNCPRLRAIPVDFADIPTLQSLHLYHASQAANSAKTICDAKEDIRFWLTVYPPAE